MDFKSVVDKFNTKYKTELIGTGIRRKKYKKIPFSSAQLNYLLRGGIPRGKATELAGAESSGKSTLSLDLCANAQRLFAEEYQEELEKYEQMPKRNKTQEAEYQALLDRGALKIVYIDVENTLDEDWAKTLGVDLDNIVVIQPDDQCAEEIFEMIRQLVSSGEVGLVILDSLAVMYSKQAEEKSIEEKTYAGISAPLTTFSNIINPIIARANCALVGINQLRDNLASSYGGTKTTGGRGWKHYCAVRLSTKALSIIDDKGNELTKASVLANGKQFQVAVDKNKVTKPDRLLAVWTLSFDNGVDVIFDSLDFFDLFGLVNRSGAWYSFVDPETGEVRKNDKGEVFKIQGKSNLKQYFIDNPEEFNKLNEVVLREIVKD